MGNNNLCVIAGIGSIVVKMFDGVVRTLTDVTYISGLKNNLISIGTLSRQGYSYKSDNGTLKVYKGAMVVIKSVERDGLFVMQGNTDIGVVAVVASVEINSTILRHIRLGHISEQSLHVLSKQGLLRKDNVSKVELFEICILAKQDRTSFNIRTY